MDDSSASEPQPRVHCPGCGKRFRVDPGAVTAEGRPHTARCSRCGARFRLRPGEDGAIEAVLLTEGGGRTSQPNRKTRPPASRPRGKRKAPRSRSGGAKGASEAPDARVTAAIGMGERVGRYEVEELLGRGGMAAVYRAFDPAANRHVALKVLSATAPPDDVVRFQREVQVQGNIQHPHIMPIFDSGTLGRSRYFAMELLKDPLSLATLTRFAHDGQAARDPLLRPASNLDGILRHVFLPVCEAIHHANVREGVIHRDLKPENVLIDRNGLRPFVIDFGICSLVERKNQRLAHLPTETPARLASGGVRVTGTLVYMPPEQARGEVDRRGDVWALGAILQYLLTGAPPLAPAVRTTVSTPERIEGLRMLVEQAVRKGDAKEAALYRARLSAVASGRERGLDQLQKDVLAGRYSELPARTPRPLREIVRHAMAVSPEQRYRHALALRDDVVAWLERRPTRAVLGGMDPARRALYRLGLLVGRQRRAAAALLVLLLAGVLLAANGAFDRAPPPAGEGAVRRIERAEEGLRTGKLSDAEIEAAARRAAGDPSTSDRALDVLATLARREELERALRRAAALADEVGRAFDAGRDGAAHDARVRLQETLAQRIEPLLTDASRPDREEAERLVALARPTRSLVFPGLPTGGALRAYAMDGPGGVVAWSEPNDLGAAPALAPGRYVLAFERGAGTVYLPLAVPPGRDALSVTFPVDPAALAPDRVYVPAGHVEGPLGTADVPALLWDRFEVTVDRYARFLDGLAPAERTRRVPRSPDALGGPGVPLWERDGDRFVPPPGTSHRAVQGISYEDAEAFAAADGARLPTAPEWAWAASGGDRRATPLGPFPALVGLGLAIDDLDGGARDVGTVAADRNPFGLMDLAGGVREWTATLATCRGTTGRLALGAGYATSYAKALLTEADALTGWTPPAGVGFRLVRTAK